MTKISTIAVQDFRVGDTVAVAVSGSRWQCLARLLRKPRLLVVTEVTAVTIGIEERRMTWSEWRRAIWSVLSRGL